MRKLIPAFVVTLFLLPFAFGGCERSSESTAQMQPTNATLSIEEARAFFDSYVSSIATRTTADNPMPFVIGDYSIDWENAEESSLPHLSSVDVPTETEFVYFVGRYDANSELYTVRADSKIIVVKESDNDAIMTYVRTTIPDAFYADVFHDQNICDLTLNCDDRTDYWGLEYYSTLDGCPIAVAKYENGECVASVYLKDESRTIENRIAAFGRLMGNTWVIRRPAEQTRVTGDGNWNYGTPGSTFYGTDGTLYIYLDHDGDGKSDSITTWALYQEMYSNADTSNGGGGGSNNQTPPYSPPDPFVPTNNGGDGNSGSEGHSNVSGGSNSGNGEGEGEGEGDPDNNQEGEQNPIVVDTLQKDTLPRDTLSNPTGPKLPAEEVNPLPYPKPIEDIKKPCADEEKEEANPLLDMQISNDNASWRSNIWGYVRYNGSKFHDGIDLLGIENETLIYSMYDGIVVRVIANQPRKTQENYPSNYNGDKNAAGNRITIESTLPNGDVIQVSYWHLAAKEHNEYTQNLSVGSTVKQGQIIGVMGNTGNAYNKKTHLHLKTYIKGTNNTQNNKNNPFNYLYTKFDINTGTIIFDC